jgi:serine/threonine-protein kinase HipA
MKRCPITYEPITRGRYSERGLHLLSRRLTNLIHFPYTAEEQRHEAALRATKMSIQGVQPKLSARLNVTSETFEVVDTHGQYILKPPSTVYPDLPQNEDLTMRLASMAGVRTPIHGMIYARDRSLTYFIKRFDRTGRNAKLALEDFAQLEGKTRETKYDSSMERVADVVKRYCTFPAVEYVRLFRLTLVNFLLGNEDMHLKNFSLICLENRVELSPAYDLLNSTVAIGKDPEEIALPLHGKKRRLTANDLVRYYGTERLGLQPKIIDRVLRETAAAGNRWFQMIEISFLSDAMKKAYARLLRARLAALGIEHTLNN